MHLSKQAILDGWCKYSIHLHFRNIFQSTFRMPRMGKGCRIMLDLGQVKNIAELYINGKPCGTLWKPPFRADITDAVKKGRNVMEVRVTNLWPNRLIGDAQPGVTKPITYSPIKFYKADDPLLPSGLLGPVQVLRID